MVFVSRDVIVSGGPSTGLVSIRATGHYVFLLIVESLMGAVVAIANTVVICVLIAGYRTLMKNTFYIIVANVMVFTTLKSIVELVFILPYYMMKSEPITGFRFFTTQYEFLIFNLSVFADYGVLFSSLLIAVNRFIVVTSRVFKRSSTSFSCFLMWFCAALIPLLFYFGKCQYAYNNDVKAYYNVCEAPPAFSTVVKCILYLSYVCCVVEILLYMIIFLFLKKKRSESLISARQSNSSRAEMKLLRQSLLIFGLYAASTISVLVISLVPYNDPIPIFLITYTENLLNLSIAAVFPICTLSMSGEMKSVLVSKILPLRSGSVTSVTSISLNNNNNNNNVIIIQS